MFVNPVKTFEREERKPAARLAARAGAAEWGSRWGYGVQKAAGRVHNSPSRARLPGPERGVERRSFARLEWQRCRTVIAGRLCHLCVYRGAAASVFAVLREHGRAQ